MKSGSWRSGGSASGWPANAACLQSERRPGQEGRSCTRGVAGKGGQRFAGVVHLLAQRREGGCGQAQAGLGLSSSATVLSVALRTAPHPAALQLAPTRAARAPPPPDCRQVVGFRAPNFRVNNLMGQVLADLQFG